MQMSFRYSIHIAANHRWNSKSYLRCLVFISFKIKMLFII